jgi:hypothetical protein
MIGCKFLQTFELQVKVLLTKDLAAVLSGWDGR